MRNDSSMPRTAAHRSPRQLPIRWLPALGLLAAAAMAAAPAAAATYNSVSLRFPSGQTGYGWLWNVPGLVTADFTYPNTEHNLRELRARPENDFGGGWERMAGLLRDRNGDDPYDGVLRWAELDYATSRGFATETLCTGTCRLPIPRPAAGEVFILAGFRFALQGGEDMRIAEIAVRPNPALGYVDVTFVDSSRTRPYLATVHYAYVPAEEVVTTGYSSQGSGPGSVFLAGSRKVLQGFRVAFTSGEHPLRRFTIDLSAGVRVRLIDVNGDDSIAWSVDWVILR